MHSTSPSSPVSHHHHHQQQQSPSRPLVSSPPAHHQQTLGHLERFTRAFVSKAVQAIVQSRIYPNKVKTESTLPNKRVNITDNTTNIEQPRQQQQSINFNVLTRDDVFITSRLSPVLSCLDVTSPFAVYVNILLRDTSSSSSSSSVLLPLEVWTISSDARLVLSSSSPSVSPQKSINNLPSSVFSAMGLMLKSILCVTRVTQTYKICRQQHEATHLIEFNIDTREPNYTLTLGHKRKHIHLGKVPFFLSQPSCQGDVAATPGESAAAATLSVGLSISLSYRTELVTTTTCAAATTNSVNKLLIKSDHYSLEDHGRNNQQQQQQDVVRPAFFDDNNNDDDDDDDDDILPFINLISPKLINRTPPAAAPTTTSTTVQVATTSSWTSSSLKTPPHSSETTSSQMSQNLLPFAGAMKTTSSSSSSASCSDLLTLFEEFRVAPATLASFHHAIVVGGNRDDEIDQFEDDLKIYDNFVNSLLN